MRLAHHLNKNFEFLIGHAPNSPSNEALIHCMDLTLLEEQPNEVKLAQFIDAAQTYPVAAVCVFPHHLHLLKKYSKTLATVVNFPHGRNELASCLKEIDTALSLGAQEIDYVFPYQNYLQGEHNNALAQCAEVINYCKKQGLVIKIILETGAFTDINTLYLLSCELILLDCDFLKTSTGTSAQGASLASVFALLSALVDSEKSCGIKISGGVKTPQQAKNYAVLAELMLQKPITKDWFRIGASSLLEALLAVS